MSAVRHLLSSLWAAVWLGWRLARLRLRRLFGGRRTPEAGPDFHLATTQIPVEGVDYNADELPPDAIDRLDAIGAKLLASVPRTAGVQGPRRRPRRMVLVAVTSLLLFGAAGAGATALVTGTTGFEAVDRVLGIYEAESQKPETLGIPIPGRRGAKPDLSHGRASISVPTADGSSFVATSYVAQSGEICSAITGLAPRSPDSVPGVLNALRCVSSAELAERLDSGRQYLISIVVSREGVVLAGLTSGETLSMRGRGPTGPFGVEVGESWSSGLPGLGTLKPFAGVSPRGDETSTKAGDLGILDPSQYSFESLD